MNRAEADRLLQPELDALEKLGYDSLAARIGEVVTFEKIGPTCINYQLELQLFWDRQPEAAIRVLGSIDDGDIRALMPLTDSRIIHPRQ